MVFIYWERQGSDNQCGAHCLNGLLQGPRFSFEDLNAIAARLDEGEALLRAPDALGEAVPVHEGSSHNANKSGNYSISVLDRPMGAS